MFNASVRRSSSGSCGNAPPGDVPAEGPAVSLPRHNNAAGNSAGFTAGEGARGDLFVGDNSTANATNYITPLYAHFGQLVRTDRLGTNFFVTDPWADFDIVP